MIQCKHKNLAKCCLYKYRSIFDTNVIIDGIKETVPEANQVIIVREMNPDDVDLSLPGMYY